MTSYFRRSNSLPVQRQIGVYYDKNGKLAAFDTKVTQHIGGVVIRKDLLDEFLRKRGLKIIWIADARKEVHNADLSISQSIEWTGLLTYGKEYVEGNIYRIAADGKGQ